MPLDVCSATSHKTSYSGGHSLPCLLCARSEPCMPRGVSLMANCRCYARRNPGLHQSSNRLNNCQSTHRRLARAPKHVKPAPNNAQLRAGCPLVRNTANSSSCTRPTERLQTSFSSSKISCREHAASFRNYTSMPRSSTIYMNSTFMCSWAHAARTLA